jgi:hypothetical protein
MLQSERSGVRVPIVIGFFSSPNLPTAYGPEVYTAFNETNTGRYFKG